MWDIDSLFSCLRFRSTVMARVYFKKRIRISSSWVYMQEALVGKLVQRGAPIRGQI